MQSNTTEKLIVRAKEMVWKSEGDVPGGSSESESKVVELHELLPVKSFGLHIEEIPPKGSTTIHKHSEAVIYILSGKGYSEIQGKITEWETGDVLYIPPKAWHRHWNKSGSEPVRFIGIYPYGILTQTIGEWPVTDAGKKTFAELKSGS